MIAYYINNLGFEKRDTWIENCWVNIENPSATEKQYILKELNVPEAFYNDIEDVDERETLLKWLFTATANFALIFCLMSTSSARRQLPLYKRVQNIFSYGLFENFGNQIN